MNDKSEGNDNDSCVALYWTEEVMAPATQRAMAFTYGLGRVSSADTGNLGLTVGGSFRPGEVFTVTAYVKEPQPAQKVKLFLPPELSLEESTEGRKQNVEQVVDQAGDYNQVSWRVRSSTQGDYRVEVASGVTRAHQMIRIRKAGLFD